MDDDKLTFWDAALNADHIGCGHLFLVFPRDDSSLPMLSVELHSQSIDTLCTISIYVLKALLRIHAINTHVPPVASLFSFRSLWVTQMPTGLFSSTCWQDGDEPAQPDRGSRVFHDWSSVGRGTAACRDSGSNHRPSSLCMFLVSQHNLKVPDWDAGKRNA